MEVQRSAILQRLNTALPPSGPLLNSLRRLDPFPQVDGPDGRRRPAGAGASRATRTCGGRGERRADPRHGVRARRRRLGLGGGAGARGHQRARRRRAGRHAGAARRPRARASTPSPCTSTRATTSRSCASPGLDAPRAASSRDEPRRGRVRRRSWASRWTARSTCAPRGSGRRAASSRPTPTGAGRCSGRSPRCAGSCGPGNSGGPVVDGDGRVVTTVFAATTRGPRGGYGVPNAVVRRALGGRAARSPPDRARADRQAATLRRAMGKTPRHRREAVRRPRPGARPARPVPEARGLPRVRRPRHDVGGRPPRPARRARRVRPEVQEVAHGGPADRARPTSSSWCATSAPRSR